MKTHGLVFLLVFGFLLYADVMYEMTTTTTDVMGIGSETAKRVFIKGDCARTEVTSKSAIDGEETTITITRLDKKVMWTLDMANEQYSESKIGEGVNVTRDTISEMELAIPEISVEKTGNKRMILENECEEVIISLTVETDDGTSNLVQTMWLAKEFSGYGEIDSFTNKMAEYGVASSNVISMIDEELRKELQKKMCEADGFPLKIDLNIAIESDETTFWFEMKSIVTKLIEIPINIKVFEIPRGFKLKE